MNTFAANDFHPENELFVCKHNLDATFEKGVKYSYEYIEEVCNENDLCEFEIFKNHFCEKPENFDGEAIEASKIHLDRYAVKEFRFRHNGDHFSAKLYRLIAKADNGNKARIAKGFPEYVAVYNAWFQGIIDDKGEAANGNEIELV